MLPLPLSLAELPDSAWLIPICIVIAGVASVGLNVALRVAREFRTNVAAELRAEMQKGQEPQAVAVQQPLEVREHTTYATTQEVAALKADVEQLRQEVREGFSKLNDERRTSVGNLHAKVDAANRKVDELGGQLQVISQQVGLVLNNLLNTKIRS